MPQRFLGEKSTAHLRFTACAVLCFCCIKLCLETALCDLALLCRLPPCFPYICFGFAVEAGKNDFSQRNQHYKADDIHYRIKRGLVQKVNPKAVFARFLQEFAAAFVKRFRKCPRLGISAYERAG